MIVKVSKEKFWNNQYGIERWPEMIKDLPNEIPVKDKNAIAETYFNMKRDEKGRLNGSYEVYGLFDGEFKDNVLKITGCHFIVKDSNGYKLSDEAIQLKLTYIESNGWEIVLMEQLLKYSPRVRSIFFALINGGKIHFEKGFLNNMSKAYLEYDGELYHIFYDKNDKANLNTLLNGYPRHSVGEFWLKEYNISSEEEIKIEGISNEEPSLNSISSHIKIPFILMEYLQWFRETEVGVFKLDKLKIKQEISSDIWESFLNFEYYDELEVLQEIIYEHKDFREFFPVSIVGKELKEKIDPDNTLLIDKWIDQYFMTGIKAGKFRIVDNESGQPRHGRGLLDKRDHQLIKLQILK
ncbi:hypothetical protein SAMN02745120_0083 [Acetoanaerobium noterae]|uniref:Uncharacterized protein n=1 Tax=Acetoanaerobium noterae TaxID=745369 RepID=A0A1T5DMV9_9FIRM|nr:hypothetical protein [Acetoanaerobium noterae]SKB73014.1 hypothetical protein SAMN02745120_0083 [Acetoanaerobium noterae]